MTPDIHLKIARDTLVFARHPLNGGFPDRAGRKAYLAALHAVHAFIQWRTGKQPRTHSGARSEFGRLSLDEPAIRREQVSFLGSGYEMKTAADYGEGQPAPQEEAEWAIGEATRLIETISALLARAASD